jgi:hypothetical protein
MFRENTSTQKMDAQAASGITFPQKRITVAADDNSIINKNK